MVWISISHGSARHWATFIILLESMSPEEESPSMSLSWGYAAGFYSLTRVLATEIIYFVINCSDHVNGLVTFKEKVY